MPTTEMGTRFYTQLDSPYKSFDGPIDEDRARGKKQPRHSGRQKHQSRQKFAGNTKTEENTDGQGQRGARLSHEG